MINEFKQLVKAISDSDTIYREDDLQFVEDNMSCFADYVDAVYRQTVLTPIYYARYEGQELRDAIMQLDQVRRRCHESAIAACSQLNRLCENEYYTPAFCPKTEDRYEIADFCAQVTTAFYLDGLNKNPKDIDNVISEMRKMNKTVNHHLDMSQYMEENTQENMQDKIQNSVQDKDKDSIIKDDDDMQL